MKQLALPLGSAPTPTFDNFITADNGECVQRLRALAGGDREYRFFYLWGSRGSGRSHLLGALRAGGATSLDAVVAPEAGLLTAKTILFADDVDQMPDAAQEGLFHLYNRVQQSPDAALVMAGAAAPLASALREDLRTRLGASLVFQVHPLTDAQKRVAVLSAARERGVAMSPELVDHLLLHYPRDLGWLMSMLDALDRFALQEKRAITLPLLREYLQRADLPPGPLDAPTGAEQRQ